MAVERRWIPVREEELPDFLPRPQPGPGVDVAWFTSAEPVEGEARLVYVCRTGNGGPVPYGLTFVSFGLGTGAQEGPEQAEPVLRWPELPDVWGAADELCLEGALFQAPAFVAGRRMYDEATAQVSVFAVTQLGAVEGSAAAARWALAGGLILNAGGAVASRPE